MQNCFNRINYLILIAYKGCKDELEKTAKIAAGITLCRPASCAHQSHARKPPQRQSLRGFPLGKKEER